MHHLPTRPSVGAMSDTIPVNVITGFLGSGKSTLLNALVNMPDLTDTAVIVNEFGEVGIDHQLISSAIDQMVLLENGCVCCEVRGDLVDTLELMEQRVAAGTIPRFARVILETTGLADPAPILHTLMIEPRLAGRYHLGRVAATVDAVNGRESLAEFAEARKQVAVADIILVTKTDLATPQEVGALEEEVALINPRARRINVTNGELTTELARVLAGEDGGDIVSLITSEVADLGAGHGRGHHHDHSHDHDDQHVGAHTGGIETASIVLDRPIEWRSFTAWIDAVTSLRGPDLLRLKGLVNVAGRAGPVVVHAVQHVVHPPVELAAWPDRDTRTRVVCITRNIPPASLTRALEAFTRVTELSYSWATAGPSGAGGNSTGRSPVRSMTRRSFLASVAASAALAPLAVAAEGNAALWFDGYVEDNGFTYHSTKFDVINAALRRQMVQYYSSEPPGTVVVDTGNHFLYVIWGNDTALRYGVGVGREGFKWYGRAAIERKEVWPRWVPPPEMLERQPDLPRLVEGGDAGNPLGPRALYLYRDGRDLGYRLHGSLEPWLIGSDVSSGCIRMFPEDVIDLYQRCPIGTEVLVLEHIAEYGGTG